MEQETSIGMETDQLDEQEQEGEVFEETLAPFRPPSQQDGKVVTLVGEGLSKHFTMQGGTTIKAVDGVSLVLTEQQFITIMGPSGSGKTTLLYLLSGLDRATAGSLQVDGVDVYALSEQEASRFRREKLGFVFQSYRLFPTLTALENVMVPMELAGGMTREAMRERARDLLLEVGVNSDRHSHRPSKLSGGQQQRVAIARALANDPKVILADEPTGNLDARTGTRIITLLKKLSEQGKTVIVVTHDRDIARLADIRLEMVEGKLRPMPKFVTASPSPVRTRVVKSWDHQPVTISAEGLKRYFKHAGRMVKAVDDVQLALKAGQFITITGPSGSGKSTLLYLLSGLDRSTDGQLQVDGVDVQHLAGRKESRFRREKLGFIFQSYHLLPTLTALENVMLPMQLGRGMTREQMQEQARMLLVQVGVSEDRHQHRPSKLSGGQQQRVAIARALANDPKVILADEPTGNLDALNSKRIMELLKGLAEQGKTVIVVTHDRTIARDADVQLEMEDGRIRGASKVATPARPPVSVQKKKGKKR